MSVPPVQAAWHRLSVHRILNNSRLNARNKKLSLWNYVLTTELCCGSKFLATPDGDLYVVLGMTNEIFPLSREGRGGDRWHSYFHTIYGLAAVEPIAKFIYSTLRAYVLSNGTRVEPRRFAAFDQSTQTAYLSAYDGRMFKIEGESEISVCTCGEDGKFFVDDDNGIHVEPDIGNHGILLERLTRPNFAEQGLSGITPEQQRMALIIWLFALAFPDLMPTKPIMLIEGTKGSGKTSQIELIGDLVALADCAVRQHGQLYRLGARCNRELLHGRRCHQAALVHRR